MAAGIDVSKLNQLVGVFDITPDECRILIEEYGKLGCSIDELVQTVCDKMSASGLDSVKELVWNLSENPCFNTKRSGSFRDKTSGIGDGDSWSLARSKSSNAINKHSGGLPMATQQRPASTTAQMEDYQASVQLMPYSGTSNQIRIRRTPKGMDLSTLRTVQSNCMQDTEIRNLLYDIHENQIPKVLILMRGASGSGKSTLASLLWSISEKGEICSADHHFLTRKGEYQFNPASLGEAHKRSRMRCRNALSRGDSPVIVDNTNTTVTEMMPYVEMAVDHNYAIKIVEPKTEWRKKPGLLEKKSIHNVPKQTIQKQLDRFETTSVEAMVDKALKGQGRERSRYQPNRDLEWGTASSNPSPSMGNWVFSEKVTEPLISAQTYKNFNHFAPPSKIPSSSPSPTAKIPPSPVKAPPSPSLKLTQASWKEPPPVAPSSPMRVSDFVPDFKSAQKHKKSGKKNSNGSSNSSTSPTQTMATPAPFEDPAYEALERLKKLFPSASETELEEIIQTNGCDINVCASALLEKGVEMSCNFDETEKAAAAVEAFSENNVEERSEENSWGLGSDIKGASGSTTRSNSTEVCSSSAVSMDDEDIQTTLPYENGMDAKALPEYEADMFKIAVPADFVRTLLRAFGHPEDESRVLNLDERTITIGADTAFEMYKGLYVNIHNTETVMGNGAARPAESSGSTRSNSPTFDSGVSSASASVSSVDDEFDAIAVSLSQMDLETSSGDPQLATIIDIESRLHRHTQASLREYSAPYRTMAQNISFSILKQEYPNLDPGIIDEVYIQCELNIDRTKSALNEMYPSMSIAQISGKPSSPADEAWTLRYNPRDVRMYTPEKLQEMQNTYESLEREWQSKMSKYRDYHEKCKVISDTQIKAHYITAAKKLQGEMKNLEDEIQYYRAVKLNAKHNNDNFLDLHGLRVNGAMRVLKEFLQCKEQEFVVAGTPKMILLIITGQGKHSKNGYPVLQPAVRNFLYQKGYKFHMSKPGTYSVVLTRRSVASSQK